MDTWAKAEVLIRFPAAGRKSSPVVGFGNDHGFPARFNFSSRVDVGFGVTSRSNRDVDYLGQSTEGDLNVKCIENLLLELMSGVVLISALLDIALGLLVPVVLHRDSPRGIFCSRTLNLRSISAIGYDMDYTLMHYNAMAWEGRAYDYCMEKLRNMGFPVDGLSFDPGLAIRGLVIDKER
ncbi:hypothetical protein MLD38_038733 [Melastoma candidum]|uniref:Uncharacterized protein n=1 Tax=Melastoma candidum TaxID=119954 RepID=A0ACB9L0K2_9MYRT|nr:hypothetical protein MLD38_038733 [Melastoma candidum]